MVGGVLRLEVNGFAEGVKGAAWIFQFLTNQAQVISRKSVFGTEFGSLAIMLFGLLVITSAVVSLSEVEVGQWIVGFEFESALR